MALVMRAVFVLKSLAWVLPFLVRPALAIEPPRHPHQPTGRGSRLLAYNETTPEAKLEPSVIRTQWSLTGNDGQYISVSDKFDLVLSNIASDQETVIVPADKMPPTALACWVRFDQGAVLFATNSTKRFRWSFHADYFIYDVATGETEPLVPDQSGDIDYAEFAPDGSTIAFVRGNNLYVRDASGKVHQITHDGSREKFNGVPNWLYEEEVLSDRAALWYSPDAQYIAFLSIQESDVGVFPISLYSGGQAAAAPAYPPQAKLRYPKVGTTNPSVELNIVDLATMTSANVPIAVFTQHDRIVGEVAWVTDKHSALICRVLNRVQDQDEHVVVNPETLTANTVRLGSRPDGWLQNLLAIRYAGHSQLLSNRSCYVDLSDDSGWTHLYVHPVDGGHPVQLTSGDWEVDRILHVDTDRQLVYYTSTARHSTERHVYSVSYKTKEMQPLVDDTVPAVWAAQFSTKGGYYILSYQGPDVPYQQVYSTNDTAKPLRTITSNADFYAKMDQYHLPNISYFELKHPEGFTLNVRQQVPPNFDPTKRYPSLFLSNGRPDSQRVSKLFQPLDWVAYISSDPQLEYVTYTVDNRGTGFKGQKFRGSVSKRLGQLEAKDQIWAATELLRRNAFLDPNKVGICGRSYGGFLAAKVVEADSGVFSLGLSISPVTDWRLYDSVYAERYMKTLDANVDGYQQAAIQKMDGFKNLAGGFALMHGTGDDNVHFQNTAVLVDLLVAAGVSPDKFKMMAFTDSDHSINFHGSDDFMYKFLTERLWDEVQRPATKPVHPWS